jgi:hypothetical protein
MPFWLGRKRRERSVTQQQERCGAIIDYHATPAASSALLLAVAARYGRRSCGALSLPTQGSRSVAMLATPIRAERPGNISISDLQVPAAHRALW